MKLKTEEILWTTALLTLLAVALFVGAAQSTFLYRHPCINSTAASLGHIGEMMTFETVEGLCD